MVPPLSKVIVFSLSTEEKFSLPPPGSAKTSIISKYKLGETEQKLFEHQFLRIHCFYITNTLKVTAFNSHDIH